MRVWVFTGETESGDKVGPYVFHTEPSPESIRGILKKDMPSEFPEDRSEWVDEEYGYVSCSTLETVEVRP